MDMESNLYHSYIVDLLKAGKVTDSQLDQAVRRVLRVKFALGLFDNPYTDEKRKKEGPLSSENLELVKTAAERSLVLLKNAESSDRRPVLPLKKQDTVALIGPLADDAGNMLGSGQAGDRPQT
jgi:beta-glucosidase